MSKQPLTPALSRKRERVPSPGRAKRAPEDKLREAVRV
jgi:hypothetical protein